MPLAITTCMPDKFREDLFGGYHLWRATAGNTFRLGLFKAAAAGNRTYNKDTENYTSITASPSDENAGTGYTGAAALTLADATHDANNVAWIDFTNDVTYASSTISSRGAFIYNDTHVNDRVISLHDFGSDKASDGGDFTVQAPAPAFNTAILRLA